MYVEVITSEQGNNSESQTVQEGKKLAYDYLISGKAASQKEVPSCAVPQIIKFPHLMSPDDSLERKPAQLLCSQTS